MVEEVLIVVMGDGNRVCDTQTDGSTGAEKGRTRGCPLGMKLNSASREVTTHHCLVTPTSTHQPPSLDPARPFSLSRHTRRVYLDVKIILCPDEHAIAPFPPPAAHL